MKSRILIKGTELYFRYGVKTVTMDAIANELGISKKTIYQHFPDKDTMVFDVVKAFIEQDNAKWDELDRLYSNVLEKIFKSCILISDGLDLSRNSDTNIISSTFLAATRTLSSYLCCNRNTIEKNDLIVLKNEKNKRIYI